MDLDLLLDLKFESDVSAALNVVAPKYVTSNYNPLLSHAAWPIGISVGLCFARETSPLSSSMCTIMLKFTNHLTEKSPMIKFLPKVGSTLLVEYFDMYGSSKLKLCSLHLKLGAFL